jgi:acylphosphatase
MEARIHVIVEGLVQGVGFRWFAARHAQGRNLRGYVRNCVDGSVEIDAEGEKTLLEEFLGELRTGPRSAMVRDIEIEWLPPARAGEGFHIRD